jgi:hypothetical protein
MGMVPPSCFALIAARRSWPGRSSACTAASLCMSGESIRPWAPKSTATYSRYVHGVLRRLPIPKSPGYRVHGALRGRQRMRLATSSPMNSSLAGSHFSGRLSSMAMLPK